MNSLARRTLVLMLATALSALGGCGGSDDSSQNDEIGQLEIRSLAAYNCMPKDLRRQLRLMEKQHDARVRQLARRTPPGVGAGTTGSTQQQFQQIVEADPKRRRLLRRAQALYRQYLPGGSDYEARCYLREREKARARLAALGATGS